MAIDPAVLRRQRAETVDPESRPKLTLVVGDECDTCGRPLSTLNRTGTCRRCAKRQWMRDFRAVEHRSLERKGPKLDPERVCPCGRQIAARNATGYCAECQRGKFARTRRYFIDGGGI